MTRGRLSQGQVIKGIAITITIQLYFDKNTTVP